jgi:tetratricopeptide (TPR) repeat protein
MQEVIDRLGTTGNQGSVDMLRLMGLFADAAAPLDLLRAAWTQLGREEIERALQPLVDLHLVEADESLWTMHRLVRAQARMLERQLPELEAQEHVLADGIKALGEYALTDYGKLAPHVVEVSGRTQESESAARVLGEASLFLRRLGRYSEAKAWSEEALRIDLAVLGKDHHTVATLRSNLATILQDLGDLEGARRELEEALRIDLAALGKDHYSVAIRRSNLALILKDLGDLEGARRGVEEALRIDLAVLGRNHHSVAIRRSNLATILQDLGDIKGARREVEEALRITLAALGKDHHSVAIRRSNLAMILKDLGDLEAARREATEAVRIVRLLPPGASTRETILSLWSRQKLPGL